MVREKYILLPPEGPTTDGHPPVITKNHRKNLNAYRITEADRLGEGGPKLKFQKEHRGNRNAAATRCRGTDGERRRKSHARKITSDGAQCAQVFDVDNPDWRKEQFRLQKFFRMKNTLRPRPPPSNAHYSRADRHRRDVSAPPSGLDSKAARA